MINENNFFGGLKATGEILLDIKRGIKLLYSIEIVEDEKVKEEEPIYMREYDYDQETGNYYGYRLVRLDKESFK